MAEERRGEESGGSGGRCLSFVGGGGPPTRDADADPESEFEHECAAGTSTKRERPLALLVLVLCRIRNAVFDALRTTAFSAVFSCVEVVAAQNLSAGTMQAVRRLSLSVPAGEGEFQVSTLEA